ncbi:MAG: hypothetical protein HYU44_01050, partial [Betaproteobacteria bacterium]|nr:hypothetical protein [Betaproteobacteria bacterium]
ETRLLRCIECWGIDTPEIQEFIADNSKRTMDPKSTSGRGLARRIYNTGQPVWITDISQEKDFLPAPKIGQHSVEILREIGYDDAAIEAMIASDITSDGRINSPDS